MLDENIVFCQLQLSSSIGLLELSGEQCPGTLTLTCHAVNFGYAESINWFVGDDRLAVFHFVSDSTPFTTTTKQNLLNATVQLQSATLTNGLFSFINFTLSAGLSNFLSLQGQNITCGSFVVRSSSFEITEFTVINESSLYSGMYHCLGVTKIKFTKCMHAPVYHAAIVIKVFSIVHNLRGNTDQSILNSPCEYIGSY